MTSRRVDVLHEFGKTRVQRWRSGQLNQHTERTVTIGVLASGEWWAEHSADRPAYAFGTEREARSLVERWLADGAWVEMPAEFGPDGLPTSDGWVPYGQTWRREAQIDE